MTKDDVWVEVYASACIGDGLGDPGDIPASGPPVPEAPAFGLVPGTRLPWIKTLVLRGLRVYTRYQVRFNDWATQRIREINDRVSSASQEASINREYVNAMRRTVHGISEGQKDLARQLSVLREDLASISNSYTNDVAVLRNDLTNSYEVVRDQVLNLRDQLIALEADPAPNETRSRVEMLEEAVVALQHFKEEQERHPRAVQASGDEMLNRAFAHDGPLADEGLWFNYPVAVGFQGGVPRVANVNERILEHAFVVSNVVQLVGPSDPVLDVGCSESLLPLELASYGYRVHGVDYRPYRLSHPNLVTFQGDFLKLKLEESSYGAVVFLSSIEHFGLGWYGDPINNKADRQSLDKASKLLKRHGYLIITVPISDRMRVTDLQRIYDPEYFIRELEHAGFEILDSKFGIRVDPVTWVTKSADEPFDNDEGVYMVICQKPG